MPEMLLPPVADPTLIFELYRGSYATELLCAAVKHFGLFEKLAPAPLNFDGLRRAIGLERRPAMVLITALRAMKLIDADADGRLSLSPLARQHLLSAAPHDVSGYVGLSADSPGVLEMVRRLRSNRPAGSEKENETDTGVAFIYRDGIESAMDKEASARRFTLALAGRAKVVAPVLARNMPLSGARLLLDVGGGTGIYSFAYLQSHPQLRAILFDRAEVLKVAAELAAVYGVSDRVEFRAGDMFADQLPEGCDAILISNILHDWDEPECELLVQRCAAALRADGLLMIHDVFLDDDLGGPLPIALYSAALFSVTEGRAYSAAEYRRWLSAAGWVPGQIVPTLVHCGVLPARMGR